VAEADRARRSYALVIVGGLASAGAVVVGASRPWLNASARVDGLPQITASVEGTDVAPLAGALGFVLLASFGAVLATRGWVRRGVGVVIAVSAAAVVVSTLVAGSATNLLEENLAARGWLGGSYTSHVVAWRWVVVVGAALCLVAGFAVVRLANEWATMGSRYDGPAAAEPAVGVTDSPSEAEVWKAIDRGHDPTQTP
jgi:uncharacterized membrane protein (TIGR02234 family)